jgi:hypothetical protein
LNFLLYIFSHIVKKIIYEKSHIIKLYWVHGPVHDFGILTQFTANLSFLFIFI